MSTYIRAVVAAKAIAEKYGIPLGNLVDTFADIPAADVVPVIHCKDCVYAQPLKDSKYDYLCRYWNGHSCNQNQFCSQGKRKEDENEKKDTNDK